MACLSGLIMLFTKTLCGSVQYLPQSVLQHHMHTYILVHVYESADHVLSLKQKEGEVWDMPL